MDKVVEDMRDCWVKWDYLQPFASDFGFANRANNGSKCKSNLLNNHNTSKTRNGTTKTKTIWKLKSNDNNNNNNNSANQHNNIDNNNDSSINGNNTNDSMQLSCKLALMRDICVNYQSKLSNISKKKFNEWKKYLIKSIKVFQHSDFFDTILLQYL